MKDSPLIKLVFFCVAIFVCELTLKFLDYPFWMRNDALHGWQSSVLPDDVTGWRHKSGRIELGIGDRRIIQTFGEDGRRLSTYDAPDPNAKKIILLGDSFVEGFGLSDDETIAWNLQRKITNLSILNFGAGGYGAVHNYLQLKRVIDKEQNIAGVYYIFNTFDEVRSSGSPRLFLIIPWEPPPSLLHLPFAVETSEGVEIQYTTGTPLWALSQWSRVVSLVDDVYKELSHRLKFRNDREITLRLIAEMAKLCKQRGIPFNLTLLDGMETDLHDYRTLLTERGVSNTAIPIVQYSGPEFRQADGHPNARLDGIIADRIEALIKFDTAP